MRYPLSVLDLIPVASGTPASLAVRRSVDLAQLAEELGYVRYWISEHHSMPSLASPAPEPILAHVAARTDRIRVGPGGIMLPNHKPLRVAELFHTMEALYPGRMDLGIGRAPGSDARASKALGAESPERFGDLFNQMLSLSRGTLPRMHPINGVKVMPNDVGLPPIWILGSSGASAAAAGGAGMGYSFASHFSATPPGPAITRYREAFQPSDEFPEPHAILGVSVICAPTEDEAEYLAASFDLAWLRLNKGDFQPLPTPEEAMDYDYTEGDRELIAENRQRHVVGDPQQVRERLDTMMAESGADELMVVSNIHDHEARLRAYRLIAETG